MVEKRKPVRFLEIFVKSLIVCYIASGIAWAIWLAIWSPWYYVDAGMQARPQDHINTLALNIPILSLLPLVVSVTTYRMFKTRFNLLRTILSSWVISNIEILSFFYIIYAISWGRMRQIPPQSVFLSFLPLGILAIVYFTLKKQKRST
jgi:hypothetical protein